MISLEKAQEGNLEQRSHRELAHELRGARESGGSFQLDPRLLVRLSGRDAFRYLNGQITRDLSRLKNGEVISACILTPKGRLCAPLLISRDGEDLLVEADPSLEESLLARLDRYLVADEVTVSVETSDPVELRFHCFGAKYCEGNQDAETGIRISRLGVEGFDCKTSPVKKTLPALLDPRVVETLRIERGIPRWGSEMCGENLPPEVGLDRTHIDYDRGCYPGQEVISRLKSIGRVNRLLHGLIAAPGQILRAGMPVMTEEGEGREIGLLTSAAEQFDTGCWVALSILARNNLAPLFALDPLTGERTPLSIVEIFGS